MAPPQVELLLREVARTAQPGAVVVMRSYAGATAIPARYAEVFVEDAPLGARLTEIDRSLVLRRVTVYRMRAMPSPSAAPA